MKRASIAAFVYHDVTDQPGNSGFQRPGAWPYKLSRREFRAHLDAIAQSPHAATLAGPLDLARGGRRLLLTFDDGGASAIIAGDELARRGWVGHFFLVTSRIGQPGFLDAAGIRYLRQAGHVIGSHSHTHPDIFRDESPQRMDEEWRVSCARLAALLGEPCVAASVPGGDISPAVLASAAAAGVRYLFTSEPWLAPRRVRDSWVLGRYTVKTTTPPDRVGRLAQFRGWTSARVLRRVKVLARFASPTLYRLYVRRRTRESTTTVEIAAEVPDA